MAKQVKPTAIDEYLKLDEVLPAIKGQTVRLVRSTSDFTVGVAKIYRSLLPMVELINRRGPISEQDVVRVSHRSSVEDNVVVQDDGCDNLTRRAFAEL